MCWRQVSRDVIIELADALTVAADHACHTGDLASAAGYVSEALTIAAPRRLIPIQAAALTMRAHIAAANHATAAGPTHLNVGRDAADAALRLATGAHSLPWQELDALRARARLDQEEGVNHGWDQRVELLQRQLIPGGLDPDPVGNETA